MISNIIIKVISFILYWCYRPKAEIVYDRSERACDRMMTNAEITRFFTNY